MKKKKFCCDDFEYRFKASREMGINIRVVKLTVNEVFNEKELSFLKEV